MHGRLVELVGRLESAVHRRSPAPGRSVPDPDGSRAGRPAAMHDVLAVLQSDHPQDRDPAATDRIDGLAEVFGLDEQDELLLAVAAFPHLDANVALLCGLLQGSDRPAGMSVGLAMELTGTPTLSAEAFDRIGGAARLRRAGLLDLVTGSPWLSQEIRVPERVLAHLAGSDAIPPDLLTVLTPTRSRTFPRTAGLVRILSAGQRLVWIHSPRGTAGLALAAGVLETLRIGRFTVDLRRVADPATLPTLVADAIRETALRGCGLVVAGAELLAAPGRSELLTLLESGPVPVLLVGDRRWDPAWLPWTPVTVPAPTLDTADRLEIWRSTTGFDDEVEPLGTLRMTPEAIGQATDLAGVLAAGRDTVVTGELLSEAARAVAGADTENRATTARFSDLILPDHADDTLRRLVRWARIRDEVLSQNPQFGADPSSRGLASLFSGSPGTGKTLAANVVAGELGLDLLRINLSEIVDKYIGETEKNLERVFHQAETLNVVLFFDEADALFGSRSEVKDAHDRYANQEVAYLLQRLESYDGITILATNLRGNLDQAFVRRLRFIIHFPDPDLATRRRIWELYLGRVSALDQQDPVDLDLLAGALEVAGGDIRNIMLSATFDAASARAPLGMRHLLAATEREFHKLGRRMPAAGLGRP